jgi:hypothetical protein
MYAMNVWLKSIERAEAKGLNMNNERRAYVTQVRELEQLRHEAELLRKMTLFFTRLYSHPLYFALIREKDFAQILDEFSHREFDVLRWNEFFNRWKQSTD